MDEDSLIGVLCYHSPHLFWVEVKNHDTYTLQQVGLFGVVPRKASLVDGERVCTKSEFWDPKANDIVEEFLESKHQLYFKSIYRLDDENIQTSIFNDQPHIFGEISSVRKDGVRKHMSVSLDNSVYAYKSKNEFWQMLDEGTIKTRLDDDAEIEILQKIVNHYQAKGTWNKKKEAFISYLSPAQLSKLCTEQNSPKLTTKNLEKHQFLTRQHSADIIEKPPKITAEVKTARPKNYQDYNNDRLTRQRTADIVEKPAKIIETRPKKYQDFSNDRLAPVEFVEDMIKKYTVETKNENVDARKHIIVKERGKESLNDNGSVLSKITVYDEEINPQNSGDEDGMNERAIGRANSRSHRSRSDTSRKNYENQGFLSNKEKLKLGAISREERSGYLNSLEKYEESYASPSGNFEERLVAYGPPIRNRQSLVRKLKKEYDSPSKLDEEIKNGGKNDVFGEKVKTIYDETDSRFKENVWHKTDVNDKFYSQKGLDLNDPKTYNDYVQKIQCNNEMKVSKLRGMGRVSEKENSGKMEFQKVEQSPAKNTTRNKLLEMMRKRKPKLDQSLSSTDDSLTQNPNLNDTSSTKSNSKNDDSDDELEDIHAKLKLKHETITFTNQPNLQLNVKTKPNVNPYKNLDGSKSVFVENLVQPLLLAHTKNDNKILPQTNLRDIPFKPAIHNKFRNMAVNEPSHIQSVSWPYILRGHSMFIIGTPDSGKTLGYIPAVCNLVMDYSFDFSGNGPIVIIVCATAFSVTNVADTCQMFLNCHKVVACFPGVDSKELMTSLLNGCSVLVSTPSMLYRLLGAEIGVDLRRLTTVVFDDCERLEQVYELEVKAIHLYVKKMLKSRTDKQVKVQYVLASRKWCDFMNPLAKKVPDPIVTFGAFHECVLYSKTHTSVSFVKKSKKIDAVLEFLKETDDSKLTVIVCRSDDEVELLETTLTDLKFSVVACNSKMTIHDLYKLRTEEFSSILVCCDGNLKHLNVTYANYLVHFSMPAVYTQFCKRFVVLNENYASIFGTEKQDVKIKIFLEETNVEQLPKILRFVKRCSSNVPEALNEISRRVLEQKDMEKAKTLVSICSKVLAFGECEDMYTCKDRHAVLEGYDEPKAWMPRAGVVTFKIIHYHTATLYSARALTHFSKNKRIAYQDTYKPLCMKLGMYFSKENNKRSPSELNVGGMYAVRIRKNLIARCQVLQIKYEKGQAKYAMINLVDEEKIDVVSAVELYYLPEEFKACETYVLKVCLAGVKPQDNDLTFSELAKKKLKTVTDNDAQLYFKGSVVMSIGNTVFVSTLEACAELTALGETVVKHDFKKILLDKHAVPNPDHLPKLKMLCDVGNLKHEVEDFLPIPKPKARPVKVETKYQWAHLDKNDWSDVIFSNTINAGKFFMRPRKFNKCIKSLISDIKKHVADNPEAVESVSAKDVVLAEFPDDSVYERAIIEEVIDDTKVMCFFVDNADWREVAVNKLKPLPQKFIKQIPFQSIECRLIGVKPHGEEWTEFSTNWLHDNCLADAKGNPKSMYVKYFTKEKAEVTGGHKYGVILVDTTTEDDVVINKRIIELNLAVPDEKEIEYLEKPLDFMREKTDTSSLDDDFETDIGELQNKTDEANRKKDLIPIPIKLIPNDEKIDWETNEENNETADARNDSKITPYIPKNSDLPYETPKVPLKDLFREKPIRSLPLVGDSDEDCDKWDVCIDEDLGKCFGLSKLSQSCNKNKGADEGNSNELSKGIMYSANVSNDKQIDKYVDKTHSNKKTTQETEDNVMMKNDLVSNDKILDEASIQTDTTADGNLDVVTKAINKTVDTDSSEIDSFDILRGEIKDVSLYDSDDTLSIITTNDTVEISMVPTKTLYKREPSILDSDDTRSILTEIDKESSIDELNATNKSVLDSDDSENKDVQPRQEYSNVEIYKEAKILRGSIIEVKSSGIRNIIKSMKGKATKNIENKVIPITEIPKAQTAMNASVNNNVETVVKGQVDVNVKEANKIEKVDKESASEMKGKTITITQTTESVRTPQLVWRQNNNIITIKIKVIVDEYTLKSGNNSLEFSAYQNDVKYAFNIELYGVIDNEKTTHSNKGQYVLVTLEKMLKRKTNWLILTRDIKNWIIYDVDSIDASSDEETPVNDDALKTLMDHHEKAIDMYNLDDDDVDFTSGYRYRN